jgi:hypothetical protein
MAIKQNWEAMLTAWKTLVAKPQNAALRAVEKNGNYLSRMLQEVKLADAHFDPGFFKRYQNLCLRLDLLISRCKDITDHYAKGLPEASKFLNGVSQAAKNRKTDARLEVTRELAVIKQGAEKVLRKLIAAGSDLAAAADAWLPFYANMAAGPDLFEFPKLDDPRRKILNMPPPNTKVSKLTMHDYKAAIFNLMQATDRAF